MVNWIRFVVLFSAFALTSVPTMAAPIDADEQAQKVEISASATNGYGRLGLGLGAGLVIIGAGLGIGRIGGQAVDAIARQPEANANIQTAMIIAAALIEGAAFFALILIGFLIS